MTAAPKPTPINNLDAALDYAARGWRVIPIPPGQKHPAILAWQTKGTTDPDRIRHWWTQAPADGIGILTGPGSGIFVLDIDVSDGKRGDETLAGLEEDYGPLPDTFTVITGSGGQHRYFRSSAGDGIRNNQSGRIGAGIDVRGDGGQVLAPPTIHPNGRPYEHDLGSPHEIAEAPPWLIMLLSLPEEPDEPPRPHGPSGRTDRPGDQWAASISWDALLEPDGWTKLRPGPEGEDRWTRPGKDRSEGPSATVGYKGSDVLKVFTSSVPELNAEETYTKLGYVAATRFGGDHAKAAGWCREQGYGDGHGDVRDLAPNAPVVAGGSGAQPPYQLPPPAEPGAPWPDPTPWPAAPALPGFPIPSLPVWAQEHCLAAADALQVPPDMVAMLIIGSLSSALTGRAQVWIHDGWAETLNLYLVVAMRSGAGKSPAEKAAAGWLRKWERERMAAAKDAHDDAQVLARHAETKYKKLKDSALADPGDVLDAARRAAEARDAVPPLPRLIIDDTTPEAVAGLLHAHGEALAILSTEADLFDSLLKGKNDQRQSLNVYLKAWSGDELRRDRKGSNETGPESVILERPLLSVSVTVQPSVLAQMLTDEQMSSRGFAARFMFSMPADLMGRRDQRRRFRAGNVSTAAAYEATARGLADRWASWGSMADLRLSAGAADLLEDLLVDLEPDLAVGGRYERLAEWVAKMTASVARFAGILHLSEGSDPQVEISPETMARAVALGRYWIAHAEGVTSTEEERLIELAEKVLRWAAEEGKGALTVSEIHKGMRSKATGYDVGDYVAPLALLEAHGWVRYEGGGDWQSNVGVRGAPSPVLHLLPSVVGQPQSVRFVRVVGSALWERDFLSPSTNTPNTSLAKNTTHNRHNQDPAEPGPDDQIPAQAAPDGGPGAEIQAPKDDLDWDDE